ncbi:CU044_5270 family protein [Streptomyces sp. NPDC001920]
MDELTLVRDWGADQAGPSGRARAAARARLETAMAEEARAVAPRRAGFRGGTPSRRLVLRTALVGATATAVGVTVVVADRGEEKNTPRLSTVSATEVLRRAADRSRAASDLPVPRDDQYFYTRTRTTRTPVNGGRTRTWTDEAWISVDGSRPARREEYGKVHDDPPLGEHEVLWPPTTYAALSRMPTDPDKLLSALRLHQKPAPKSDRMAFSQGCLLMKGQRVMPPGLQAAAFEALSKLPRIRLDDRAVAGRNAVGVSYPGMDFTFLFDRETYDYLGLRVKGSVPKKVNGEWVQTGRYYETRRLQDIRVVDRIGQRR